MIIPLAREYIATWTSLLGMDYVISLREPEVTFPDSNFGLWFENDEWTVTQMVLVRGAARTLNDPGDPDTTDIVDVQSFGTLKEALTCVGFHMVMEAIARADEGAFDSIYAGDEP